MKDISRKIQLPKKIQRDLDNYHKLINQALEFGQGKYAFLSAETLHQMQIFYYLTKYSPTVRSLERAYKYSNDFNKTSDFFIPSSIDEWFLKRFQDF